MFNRKYSQILSSKSCIHHFTTNFDDDWKTPGKLESSYSIFVSHYHTHCLVSYRILNKQLLSLSAHPLIKWEAKLVWQPLRCQGLQQKWDGAKDITKYSVKAISFTSHSRGIEYLSAAGPLVAISVASLHACHTFLINLE